MSFYACPFPKYTAHIEPLTAILRVFHRGQGYGDPYEWCATLRWIDHETMEVIGAMRSPSLAEYHSTLYEFKKYGVKFIQIKRIKNGKIRSATIGIEKAIEKLGREREVRQ